MALGRHPFIHVSTSCSLVRLHGSWASRREIAGEKMMFEIHTLVRSCSSRSQRGGDGHGWRALSGPEMTLGYEGESWTRCFLPFSSRRSPAKVANEQASAEQGI